MIQDYNPQKPCLFRNRNCRKYFSAKQRLKYPAYREVPLFDSQAAENWEAGVSPALPPQR